MQLSKTVRPRSEALPAMAWPWPGPFTSVQPGGGVFQSLERTWGRWRRVYLRRFRKDYVAMMHKHRQGTCHDCPHDIIDARDLKYLHRVCGFSFPPESDRFRWRGKLGLARMGLAEVVVAAGFCLLLACILGFYVAPLAALPLALAVWVVAFFRDPMRQVPSQEGLVVAPADGRIDDIGELEYCAELDGPAYRIGIFLSLFNVHVNRSPAHARVVGLAYRPGQHRATYRVGKLEDNEMLLTMFESLERPGTRMLVRQISGPAARRIVCELQPGQELKRGQRFGLIKFGSRTELYLPRDVGIELRVTIGQRVRAGESILALLGPRVASRTSR